MTSARDRRWLYLSAVAALAAVRFGWVPAHAWYTATATHVRTLERLVQRKDTLAGAALQINQDLERSNRAIAQVEEAYFPPVESPQALELTLQRQVEALASRTGVALTRVDWATPSQTDVVKAAVRVDAVLPYSDAVRFLAALERGLPALYLESFRITRRPEEGKVELSVEVLAYALTQSPKEVRP